MRQLIRPPIGLADHQTFYQNDKILQFCDGIVKNYFHSDIDDNAYSKDLIIFANMLINLAKSNSHYIPHLKNLIEKIIRLDVNSYSFELVEKLLLHKEQFQLEYSTVNNLYVVHKSKLIEEPLIDCFISNLNTKKYNFKTFSSIDSFDKLMQYTAKSPKIFQICCNILQELFAQTEYSSLLINYIQFVLENLLLFRKDDKKYIVDLYPMDLQSFVILLKLDPCQHTKNSKKYMLQNLKEIYKKNNCEYLILMTHFPMWLNSLSNGINDI